MGELFDRVRAAIAAERYVFSDHANNALRERGVIHWHVVTGVDDARVLSERPQSKPNPTVELQQALPDATPIKAVWAYVAALDLAKLVTVHFFDTR